MFSPALPIFWWGDKRLSLARNQLAIPVTRYRGKRGARKTFVSVLRSQDCAAHLEKA